MKEKTKHAVDERKQLEEKLSRVTREKLTHEKKLSQVELKFLCCYHFYSVVNFGYTFNHNCSTIYLWYFLFYYNFLAIWTTESYTLMPDCLKPYLRLEKGFLHSGRKYIDIP